MQLHITRFTIFSLLMFIVLQLGTWIYTTQDPTIFIAYLSLAIGAVVAYVMKIIEG